MASIPNGLLSALPSGLRGSLIEEYRQILQNYLERRWSPSELSGGRFCEIAFTILDGYAKGSYSPKPVKPKDFVSACRALESNTGVPRSFQILIPRLLLALYEIRNNRGVGHVGGDVNPNHMDATAVVAIASWIMAELIRVLHGLSVREAQEVVDSLSERRSPLVWSGAEGRLVLDPTLALQDQVLLLLDSALGKVAVPDLLKWCTYSNKGYFLRLLRKLQDKRLVVLSDDQVSVEILPPGSAHVEKLLSERRAG